MVGPGVRLVAFVVVAASFAAAATAAGAGARLRVVRTPLLAPFATAAATEVSTNWAGYAAAAPRKKPFASVTGRWVQPAATCPGRDAHTFSAFWVGLGGYSRNSFAVEQTGTQANCFLSQPTYSAWFELFPAPPANLKLATVSVNKRTVLIRLKNVTANKLFMKRFRMKRPDVTSAEWIAEAPTGCDYLGNCTTLPLTNFGTVDFSRGSATVKGHKGRISDPRWPATAIELHGDLDDPRQPSLAGANAIPGALGADGGSFRVSWQELTPPPTG
jgi:Peptidase A4 family